MTRNFDVLTAMVMKSFLSCGITPCSPLKKSTDVSDKHAISIFRLEEAEQTVLATCFHAGFSLGLFFDSEDGGDMLLRNVG
jgi:hypothetical protein